MINETPISYILSTCNNTINSHMSKVADDNNINIFILEDQYEPICEKRLYILLLLI